MWARCGGACVAQRPGHARGVASQRQRPADRCARRRRGRGRPAASARTRAHRTGGRARGHAFDPLPTLASSRSRGTSAATPPLSSPAATTSPSRPFQYLLGSQAPSTSERTRSAAARLAASPTEQGWGSSAHTAWRR
ncbi:hypothetical protein GQ55_5G169400 [Panicum hallii var. hallii]|uniref:Uncharacterized protein n=1 Tax=Panicum hallii var. hallii TaxID=1504633 RepID=A0A2T7DH59_9POAL|nr:hypothetical protein GQ55_5G169400 [Panicum hallii var. hallii]